MSDSPYEETRRTHSNKKHSKRHSKKHSKKHTKKHTKKRSPRSNIAFVNRSSFESTYSSPGDEYTDQRRAQLAQEETQKFFRLKAEMEAREAALQREYENQRRMAQMLGKTLGRSQPQRKSSYSSPVRYVSPATPPTLRVSPKRSRSSRLFNKIKTFVKRSLRSNK